MATENGKRVERFPCGHAVQVPDFDAPNMVAIVGDLKRFHGLDARVELEQCVLDERKFHEEGRCATSPHWNGEQP